MFSAEGIGVSMSEDCTAHGTETQPTAVQPVCYRIRMRPADPKTFLWKNIARLAKVPNGSAREVSAKLQGKIAPTTLQPYIKETRSPTTDTLVGLADVLGVEVWELLVPPGQEAEPRSAPTPTVEEAIEVLLTAIQGAEPSDRSHVIYALSKYLLEPDSSPAAYSFVLEGLGGAPTQRDQLRQVR